MENEGLTTGYSFNLKRISLLEKTLTALPQMGPQEEFDFDISLQIGNNLDLKEIIYVMQVIINTRKTSEKIGSIKLRCTFHVPNFEEYILNKESGSTLPQDLLYLLNTVVIGTMRGIMFSEFRGTILNNALLPVLDPRQFQETQ